MGSSWLGAGKLQDLTEIGAGLDGPGSAALLLGFSLSRGELRREGREGTERLKHKRIK